LECCCLEDGAFVSFVVSMKAKGIIGVLRTARGLWRT